MNCDRVFSILAIALSTSILATRDPHTSPGDTIVASRLEIVDEDGNRRLICGPIGDDPTGPHALTLMDPNGHGHFSLAIHEDGPRITLGKDAVSSYLQIDNAGVAVFDAEDEFRLGVGVWPDEAGFMLRAPDGAVDLIAREGLGPALSIFRQSGNLGALLDESHLTIKSPVYDTRRAPGEGVPMVDVLYSDVVLGIGAPVSKQFERALGVAETEEGDSAESESEGSEEEPRGGYLLLRGEERSSEIYLDANAPRVLIRQGMMDRASLGVAEYTNKNGVKFTVPASSLLLIGEDGSVRTALPE